MGPVGTVEGPRSETPNGGQIAGDRLEGVAGMRDHLVRVAEVVVRSLVHICVVVVLEEIGCPRSCSRGTEGQKERRADHKDQDQARDPSKRTGRRAIGRHRTGQVPPAVDTIRFEHKPHGGIPSIRTCVRLSDDPSGQQSGEMHAENWTPDRPYQGDGQPTTLFSSSNPFGALLRIRSSRFTGGWRARSFMSHDDDDIPLFVSSFDIAMSLGDLFKGVALIDDRSKFSRLHELLKENHVLDLYLRDSADDLPASGPQASKTRRQEESADIDASSLQRLHAPRKRELANRVVNQIVWA